MNKKRILSIFASIILGLAIITLSLSGYYLNDENPSEITVNQRYVAEYVRIVDGDTAVFNINGDKYKVRFIGIDTPESVKENTPVEPYAKEASNFTNEQLSKANEIIIETDSEANLYDNHERLLGYIFVDGEFLQELLLEEGLAEVKYIHGDYKYLDELYAAQDLAKDQHLNIWSK